jgi:hypothetical protein
MLEDRCWMFAKAKILIIRAFIPLSTPRFFVCLAFYKPKHELPRSLFFGKKNVQTACKMLFVSIGGSGCANNVFKIKLANREYTPNNHQPKKIPNFAEIKNYDSN